MMAYYTDTHASVRLNELTHLGSQQQGQYLDIINSIYLKDNISCLITISLTLGPRGAINMSAPVHVMARRLFGTEPLPEPVMIQFDYTYVRHRAPTS